MVPIIPQIAILPPPAKTFGEEIIFKPSLEICSAAPCRSQCSTPD